MKRFSLLVFIVAVFLTIPLLARQIDSDIIQIKLNRIYFASGSENGVQTGASFKVVCYGDEVISGTIEYAGPGISFSRPLAELDTLELDDGCIARLTTSGIDSTAYVTIGTDIPIEFFDPEHETLFIRRADTVIPNLVDSARFSGNSLILYLPHDIRFSDGTPYNAEVLAFYLQDIKEKSRSYLSRYFFSRLLPIDAGGIEIIDSLTVHLNFYHPFPRAEYFLSHPDFSVYNRSGAGTGVLANDSLTKSSIGKRVFVPNGHYRGEPPAFSKMIVRYYEQQYRLKFAYENQQIDGFIGFGFEADLAGSYEARALYPEIAVMIAGIGGKLFSQARFPTFLYYCFNPSLSHLYFQYGETSEVNRWVMSSATDPNSNRFYPFDFLAGRRLHSSIRSTTDTAHLVYSQVLLYETARYLADVVAREGMTAPVNRQGFGGEYDIQLAFLPASDNIMPFALYAAVLEFNDQNGMLPVDERFDRPGWQAMASGSSLREIKNRNNFFIRAEETVVQDGGFFPLFRPYIYAVSYDNVKGLDFDFYGYPDLEKIVKFSARSQDAGAEGGP